MSTKSKIIIFIIIILLVGGIYFYFKFFFTYEQKNVLKRKIDSITGQNLSITVFGFDGRVIKRWKGIEKITAGVMRGESGERNYTFFYTKEGKYVQIPDSVWYIAEEE